MPSCRPAAAAERGAADSSIKGVAEGYRVDRIGGVVRLADTRAETIVSLLPTSGNVTIEMRVRGHNVLRFPYESVDEFRAKDVRGMVGIPFLGPWANRLDEPAFYANGRRYAFDTGIGNIRGELPIHGFLTTTDRWRVVELQADGEAAWVTSRLDFYKEPAWMKQFPFAHTVEMTHRLADGVLEVTTRIENLSFEAMPVAVGFHPYFELPGSVRDEWTITIAAKTRWLLAPGKVPSGETEPIERLFPDRRAIALQDRELDDVFSDLERDAAGRATMSVTDGRQRIDVVFGPNFKAAVIYAPRDRNFICFEPMAGITDSMNLAHRGRYHELQSIAPGAAWEESFWVAPSIYASEEDKLRDL
jgi:aldose 1-epimerase